MGLFECAECVLWKHIGRLTGDAPRTCMRDSEVGAIACGPALLHATTAVLPPRGAHVTARGPTCRRETDRETK